MARVFTIGLMDRSTMVILKMTIVKVSAFCIIQTAKSLKAHGKKGRNMVKVFILGPTSPNSTAIT